MHSNETQSGITNKANIHWLGLNQFVAIVKCISMFRNSLYMYMCVQLYIPVVVVAK